MSEEIKEFFKLCDNMLESATIDFEELKSQEIKTDFFDDYNNTRLVNSFLFNFSKLQDKIGAKLFRKVLYDLKEIDDINLPMLDILNILEKLTIIEDANSWDELREIRNTIAHEYPFHISERIENIKLALRGFEKLKKIYLNLVKKMER